MNLKSRSISGVRWTSFSLITKSIIQLLQIAILARLLTPADFGLMALVATVIYFTQIIAEMGISNAIIHHQDISQSQLSSLYWANVVTGFGLWILLVLCSPLVVAFYHEPQLKLLLFFAGSIFVISAIGQQIRVVAEKKLQFSGLAKTEISAAVVGFLTSVFMAYQGYGVYSLVCGQIASVGTTTLLQWIFIADGWRPLLRFNYDEIRPLLRFGGYVVGTNLISTLNWQVDIMCAGRFLGPTLLGAYNAPRDLCLRIASIINPIATRVGLPLMAKVQNDKVRLKAIYMKTISMTAAVNFPIYLSLFALSDEIVRLFLGNQWGASVPFLRVFSLWGLLRSVGNPLGSLVYAAGRPELSFRWTIFQTAIIVPLVWIGASSGALPLAYFMLAIVFLVLLASWWFIVFPVSGASFVEFHRQLLTPFILSGISVFCAWLTVISLHGELIRATVFILVCGLLYVFLSIRFNRLWVDTMLEVICNNAKASAYESTAQNI